ncbi:uncharacterized protein LOC144112739 [Amblyomma americanum]
MSGNLAYLRRAPEGCPSTELIRIYINREDEEFFEILRRYEDIIKKIMMDWSGVEDIQCDLKTDRMDEWFLQLMVTGSRWALERLKEIVVFPRGAFARVRAGEERHRWNTRVIALMLCTGNRIFLEGV